MTNDQSDAELEVRLADLVPLDDIDEEVHTNPHSRWIEKNMNELRLFPNTWVAIDAERGIVLHETDGDAFAEKLDALPPEERERLLAFNTSMYV